jgi:hypothetical protein
MRQWITISLLLVFVNRKRISESNKVAEESNTEQVVKEFVFPDAF